MYTHTHRRSFSQLEKEEGRARVHTQGALPARTSSQGRGNTQAFIQVQEETAREGGTHTHTHTAFIQAARANS